MEQVIEFIKKYKYPIIGAIIAILIFIIDLGEVLKFVVIVALGAYIGYYIQQNKETIKQKLKNLIEKM